MARWWRRYSPEICYRGGERGDEVPGDVQGCVEAVGGVADDGEAADTPGLFAGGHVCGRLAAAVMYVSLCGSKHEKKSHINSQRVGE